MVICNKIYVDKIDSFKSIFFQTKKNYKIYNHHLQLFLKDDFYQMLAVTAVNVVHSQIPTFHNAFKQFEYFNLTNDDQF